MWLDSISSIWVVFIKTYETHSIKFGRCGKEKNWANDGLPSLNQSMAATNPTVKPHWVFFLHSSLFIFSHIRTVRHSWNNPHLSNYFIIIMLSKFVNWSNNTTNQAFIRNCFRYRRRHSPRKYSRWWLSRRIEKIIQRRW